MLKVSAIHDALELDKCTWLADMVQVVIGAQVQELDFKEFVEFLETGKPMSHTNLLPEPQQISSSESGPKTKISCSSSSNSSMINKDNVGQSGLSISPLFAEERGPPSPPNTIGIKVVSFERGMPKEMSTSLILRAGASLNSPIKKHESLLKPTQPIWQKREIVKQERCVNLCALCT
jgi:hypothetical protein